MCQVLLHYGINIYSDAEQVSSISIGASAESDGSRDQVRFYQGDLIRMMNDVLHGELDVGFLPSGWLEANYPQNIPLFKIHAVKDPRPVYQGEPFPFPTGTELVPEAGLAAAPHIPWELQKRVAFALTALNASAHPFMRAAGIATFTLAASYSEARELAQEVNILHQRDGATVCATMFDQPSEVIQCSEGYVLDSDEAVEIGCSRLGVACPQGLACVCRPCIPVRRVNVYPWQVRAHRARARLHGVHLHARARARRPLRLRRREGPQG